MTSSTASSGQIMSIQSADHEQLLNVIDDLRSQRVSDFDNLPQIIVCGDQSSGKSSVLEAISGLKFPTKDALCTRFASELVLRRRAEVSLKVSIEPDDKRPEEEILRLKAWEGAEDIHDNLDAIYEQATEVMGINRSSKNFSADVLRIVLSGPKQPHLTLVDLPGLFHSGSKSQSDEDSEAVKALVTEHMRRSRSIILAVVSAKNDLNNQIVTRYAKDYDLDGQRTLGIITKPDTLPIDSESERKFVDLAENKDVQFRLGWHVLKNRSYEERACSLAERNLNEEAFFSRGVWATLPAANVGIASLRTRLSAVLQTQIVGELSSLINDIEIAIEFCQTRLHRLGSSRVSTQEQRVYLHQISEAFTSAVQEAVEGRYSRADYFGDASTDEGFTKRIRAKVVDLTEQFRETINKKGHKYQVVEEPPKNPSKVAPFQVTQEQRLTQVREMIKRNRGIELAALSREENVTALFRDQSSPWPAIAKRHASAIFDLVREAVLLTLEATCDESTRPKVLSQIVSPALTALHADFDAAVLKVLHQHVHGFPITLNHYLTDNVQKQRADQDKTAMADRLDNFFGVHPLSDSKTETKSTFDVKSLLHHLIKPDDYDMNRVQCAETLNLMEAYYKVAKKNFIDDFAIYAVEQDLLSKLHTVFQPVKVISLGEAAVGEIAGETHECIMEREQLNKKLATLSHVLVILERLQRNSTSSMCIPTSPDRSRLSDDGVEEDIEEATASIGTTIPPNEPEHVSDIEITEEEFSPSHFCESSSAMLPPFDSQHPGLTPSVRLLLSRFHHEDSWELSRAIQSFISVRQHYQLLSPSKRRQYMARFAHNITTLPRRTDWETARLDCIVHCMRTGEWDWNIVSG